MTRPWVTPQEVRDYTDIAAVKDRTDAKLAVDISRAETRVMAICHNDFSASEYATAMPAEVKTAVILLAEAYANSAIRAKTMFTSILPTTRYLQPRPKRGISCSR